MSLRGRGRTEVRHAPLYQSSPDPSAVMRVTVELTGTTTLLCHNIQLSDPDNPFAQEMGVIHAKRKKTDDDRRAMERLEWYGGLYTAEGMNGPVMPTANVRRCFNEAAKITRQGKQVERSLFFTDLFVPLAYDGPQDIDKLFDHAEHHNRASVRIGTSRIMRVRPCFPQWAIVASAELLEDVMDPDDLARIVERAGFAEGLGDNRRNGYGRFAGRVVAA